MRDPILVIPLIGMLLRFVGGLIKRRIELPGWSADEAYMTKLQAWRTHS
jgi:hypothetical protein